MKLLIVLSLFFLAGCGALTSLVTDTTSTTPATPISLDAANFEVAYDGGGSVAFNSTDITMAPTASTASDETHAALVFIKDTVDTPLQDFELTVDLEVTQQLRQNSAPNDWEVFWLFFGYNGTIREKTANYFMTKPNQGAELGLAQGELGQKFLSSDSSAKTAVGNRYTFKYVRSGNSFKVYRDDSLFYSYTSSTFPNGLYNAKGSLGLYTEDAEVKIYSISLKRLDGRTPASTAVSPLLTSSDTQVKAPQTSSQLQVSLGNSSSTGSVWWSCTYKNLTGDLTSVSNSDCAGLGTLSSGGLLDWTPSLSQIGAWFFNFEASQIYSGFTKKTTYVQVRPTWSANQIFLYDPQFSLQKTIETQNVLVSRNIASENNKTSVWPSLIDASDSIDLSTLSEVSPWLTDSDTNLAALHFDGNQDIQGLPLTVANLGTTQDLRLSYWFKRDDTAGKAALVANHANGVLESRYWFGVISSRYTDGGSEVTCDDSTAATADWTFVTTQVTSGVLKTFVNGREVCSQNLPGTYNFSSPLRVGPKVQTFFSFAGRLSEIAGYKQSTSTDIMNDFVATADRYRAVKVNGITTSGIALHWDAANAEQGLRPSSSAAAFGGWFDLGPYILSKIFGGFDGTASSGFVSSTLSTSHLAFDGSDDYIQITANSALSLGPTWTIEAWIQPGTALGNDTNYPSNDVRYSLFKTVFEKASFDMPNKLSHGFGLRVGADNTVDAFIVNNYGTTDTIQGLTHLNPTQWYHVAASFDKTTSTFKVYVNGQLESSRVINYKIDSLGATQSDGDVISGLSDAYVGIPFDTDTRRRFNGKLAVLRVYQNTLTDAQVKANCQQQKNRFSVTCN